MRRAVKLRLGRASLAHSCSSFTFSGISAIGTRYISQEIQSPFQIESTNALFHRLSALGPGKYFRIYPFNSQPKVLRLALMM